MSDVNNLLAEMQGRFNAEAAADMDAIFQYDIENEGSWHIAVKNNECSISEADESAATVTLAMSKDTLASVISGEADGMQEFMSGSIQASGDVMLAMRLNDLFPLS